MILKSGRFECEADVYALDIIDFNRLNGYWENSAKAMETIFSWFRGCKWSLVEADLLQAPERGDFPGWDHVGDHEAVGRRYWDWFFHAFPDGELHFSDSPDFWGTLPFGVNGQLFIGDIGKVSASAMAFSQKKLGHGDLWITVNDYKYQTVIEATYSIRDTFGNFFFGEHPRDTAFWNHGDEQWCMRPDGSIYRDNEYYGVFQKKTGTVVTPSDTAVQPPLF